jgi:hypothetical protein
MSVENKLRALEVKVGIGRAVEDGPCACSSFCLDVRYYESPDSEGKADADTTPGETCAVCGREKQVLKVVYVEQKGGGINE